MDVEATYLTTENSSKIHDSSYDFETSLTHDHFPSYSDI